MKKTWIIGVTAFLIGIVLGGLIYVKTQVTPETTLSTAVAIAMKSSIKLNIQPGHGVGSGVIVTDTGLAITNAHVFPDVFNIKVTLSDGSEHSAKLLERDEQLDLAVIEITSLNAAVIPAKIADMQTLLVGDSVFAIGSPGDELAFTVTEGIISATNRQIQTKGRDMLLLQHTAAVNLGNSGGGLFNKHGELVGIVNMRSTASNQQGIGFAIPSDIMEEYLKSTLNKANS